MKFMYVVKMIDITLIFFFPGPSYLRRSLVAEIKVNQNSLLAGLLVMTFSRFGHRSKRESPFLQYSNISTMIFILTYCVWRVNKTYFENVIGNLNKSRMPGICEPQVYENTELQPWRGESIQYAATHTFSDGVLCMDGCRRRTGAKQCSTRQNW